MHILIFMPLLNYLVIIDIFIDYAYRLILQINDLLLKLQGIFNQVIILFVEDGITE